MKLRNPLAFRPGPVTFWTTAVYLAVVIPLLYVHETVPAAPADGGLARGLNLTEAWADLQAVTRAYHPYNSPENDVVRAFLLARVKQILDRNGVEYAVEKPGGGPARNPTSPFPPPQSADPAPAAGNPPGVTVFDDGIANVTYNFRGAESWVGQYFEGNNLYVYIRGKDDAPGNWWLPAEGLPVISHRTGGVLVNCHFDSVSTGYGATDDGVACVSLLQLLSYFTSHGRQPRNGIVLLFNNAEEDALLGARAFGYSPLLPFCHTFVNLEGAGAGGRAMLFRTTDLETARAYAGSPHPLGSVVAANAFERGVIRSDTDYTIFAGVYGQRGLDIAFYQPRARYHTREDDARHTSVDSVWHMVSAALASTESLSQTTGVAFQGPRSDGRKDLVQNGRPTEGVWFDWFGNAWAAFPLRGLFAWSLTLLVATPLVLLAVTYLLARGGKYYFFARSVESDDADPDAGGRIGLQGWRGFFRYPLALLFAVGLTVASVFLVAKLNPLIAYSSSYAVWAMTMSLFYFAFWLIARGSGYVRPSALQRGFAIFWLYVMTWVVEVFAAVAEDRMHIGGLYFAAFLHTAVFVALMISLLEQVALPTKHEFARQPRERDARMRHGSGRGSSSADEGDGQRSRRSGDNDDDDDDDDDDGDGDGGDGGESPTETTPLRAGEQGHGSESAQTTFANTYRRSVAAASSAPRLRTGPPHEREQAWADRLPTWTWLVQLLLLAPVHVIIVGNLGLVNTSAVGQTGVDGNSLLVPLMGIGIISILLLLPLTPFMHRVTHHVPVFLLLVAAGTLIYNLVAFPFSVNHRFKFRFQQTIDLDKGTSVVSLTGLEQFVRPVMAYLPAAAGQQIECAESVSPGLADCAYDAPGLPPNPADGAKLEDLVSANASRSSDGRTATVRIRALKTRMCYLDLSRRVYGFAVEGGGSRDDRFGALPRDGFRQIRVWRRTWHGTWNVTLQLTDEGYPRGAAGEGAAEGSGPVESGRVELKARSAAEEALEVTVRCAWDDANEADKMPAYHEVLRYMPEWAAVTKTTVGLVQVKRSYKLSS
ncbi:hypothetical protein CDD83_1574 [Cordyceps sp. RAO-2017]|nr:hypothetical protein CDD83_1574 [Cordyceps sp. RAO-2017]